MKTPYIALLTFCVLNSFAVGNSNADDKFGPSDPIAAINGDPIFLGELNLVLLERLKARNLDNVGIEIQQATAALLVRRHLAMRTLRQQGGEVLEAMIQRQLESFASEARRRGSNLSQQAKARMSDEKSLVADLAWRTAWSQYLKSRLNETNLRLYFDQQRDRYGGKRWEVSQIFVKMETRDVESIQAAKQNMLELSEEILASGAAEESFAEAARQHSDSASAGKGGMVGWVEKDGDLPSSVMAAIRKSNVGEITPPVQSPLGIHMVYIHRAEAGDITFDQLADQAQLRRDATDALFDALVAKQRGAKIAWFIRSLQPPANIQIIPE